MNAMKSYHKNRLQFVIILYKTGNLTLKKYYRNIDIVRAFRVYSVFVRLFHQLAAKTGTVLQKQHPKITREITRFPMMNCIYENDLIQC